MKPWIQLLRSRPWPSAARHSTGCQSTDRGNDNGQPPSSVGNGQTRNNGPFAPDSHPRSPAATHPSYLNDGNGSERPERRPGRAGKTGPAGRRPPGTLTWTA